nr:DsrE family protein [uncultured Allomuricauda sp.]
MKIFRAFIILSILTTLTMSGMYGQRKLDEQTVTDLQKTSQYAIGVSDERQFKGALSMYDFLVENGVEIKDYEVVVKGKIVKNLVKGSELEAFFQKYKSKVRVSICSVAMEKLGVSKDELFDGLEPIPTWSVRILQLQAKDYNVLTY